MNIKFINVDINNVYEIVRENIYSCVTEPIIIADTKFHHEIAPIDIPKALEHGLLSIRKQIEIYEHRKATKDECNHYEHEDHVNGIDGISLSNTQDDWEKMYPNESIYNTYVTYRPDIIVSQKVWSQRVAQTYYNEFVANNRIAPEFFNSIDFRILKAIDSVYFGMTEEEKVKKILEYYKSIRDVVLTQERFGLNIPIREASFVTCTEEENTKAMGLDREKVKQLPILRLK